jgi:subtilisin family serine protease
MEACADRVCAHGWPDRRRDYTGINMLGSDMRLVRVCLGALAGVAVVGACLLASSATATSMQKLHRVVAGGRLGSGAVGGGVLFPASATERPRYQPGVVLVGLRPGVPSSVLPALMRAVSAGKHHRLGFIGSDTRAARNLQGRIGASFVLRVRSGTVLSTVAWLRRQRRFVRYAEPNYQLQPAAATNVPNDPSFNQQWGSLNTGQTVNGKPGTAGADDGAARAWAHSTGSQSIVIGEVDTGVDYTHPDLAANIWSNPGGVNGCAAGTHGYNVLNSTCDPMDSDVSYNGHGTHVAGIMGAVGNNGAGVAGMNWSTTILPVKWISDNNGANYTTDLIAALDWLLKAEQAGVNIRVVNDSTVFIGTASSQALSDEIDALGANNILFVTAAGNSGQNNDVPANARYPCAYDRPTEICVTASDQNDALWSQANWGPNTVDLAAPGDNIYSTLRNGNYGYISGTSMASPQVAGAAALILSVQDMTVTALKAQILNTVDPIPALSGLVRTGGRLDVCNALPPPCGVSGSVNPMSIAADGSSTATVQASVTDAHGNPLSGETVSFTASDPGITFSSVTDHQDGTYTATVTSSTTAGQVTLTAHDRSTFGTTTLTQTATTLTQPSTAASAPQRDVTPPTVSIFSPGNGAIYLRGQRVTVRYACRDNPGGSGVAVCRGPLASGRQLHTATAGRFRFTVTSTDWAANTHVQSVRYRVLSRWYTLLSLPSRAVALHGRVRLTARCGRSASCAGTLWLFTVVTVRVHGHRGTRSSVVASTRYSVPAGAKRTITLKLTPAFQRRLRRHRRVRLQVSASRSSLRKATLGLRT